MRHLLSCLLLVCASAASAQVEAPAPLSLPDLDLDVLQGGPAWLVGDHVKARRHFRAAAERGHPLGQYNLAMMLLHREGGPCGANEAVALLHQASEAGIVLASVALAQMHERGAPQAVKGSFRCPLPTQARSTPASGGPIKSAAAR